MALVLPPREPVDHVLWALEQAGIVACVGGSALLASLGLVDVVRDWDVTTDASTDAVIDALRNAEIAFQVTAPHALFASGAHLVVDQVVEVIVGFAVRVGQDVTVLPARPTSLWDGLPMADPAVWAVAYRLMGRLDRAELLRSVLVKAPSPPGPR